MPLPEWEVITTRTYHPYVILTSSTIRCMLALHWGSLGPSDPSLGVTRLGRVISAC